MKTPAISARGLVIGYKTGRNARKVIHSQADVQLYRGELTSLIGLNGAGKSTLIKTLCRFIAPLEGEVDVLDRNITSYSAHDFALTVGVVLTDRSNASGMTVREMVSLGRQPHTGFFGHLTPDDEARVEEAMKTAGISHKADNYLSELSDGERQRAMIAKVFAQECPVVILDEPTAFLDVASRIEMMALLRETAVKHNKAILLSTHDMDNALMYSDRIWILEPQSPVLAGTPEQLVLDGSLTAFFERRGMNFDAVSGRLSAGVDGIRIGVSGDALLVRWAANALARGGYMPVSPSAETVSLYCVSQGQFSLSVPAEISRDGVAAELTFTGLQEVISAVDHLFSNGK